MFRCPNHRRGVAARRPQSVAGGRRPLYGIRVRCAPPKDADGAAPAIIRPSAEIPKVLN